MIRLLSLAIWAQALAACGGPIQSTSDYCPSKLRATTARLERNSQALKRCEADFLEARRDYAPGCLVLDY